MGGSPVRFIDSDNVCVKQRRAKLVLDLYELLHQASGTRGVATMAQWSEVRGHENGAASLRDLYRRQKELHEVGVVLAFGMNRDNVFEIDLRARGLRALVSSSIAEATAFLQARKKVRGHGALSRDDDTSASATCLNCGELSVLPINELVSKRRHGISMAAICREFHVHHRRLKVILKHEGLEGSHGKEPVERRRARDQVDKAIVVARSKSAYKLKLSQIGELLECSARTAARFIQRVKGGRVSSDRRK